MDFPTLKEKWSKMGNVVHSMDTNCGWLIFIHIQKGKDPSCGYTYKWSHVICKDERAHKMFCLVEDGAVPLVFSAEKRARDWWHKNEKRVIDALHAEERDADLSFDFDRHNVFITKADIEINIDTTEKTVK